MKRTPAIALCVTEYMFPPGDLAGAPDSGAAGTRFILVKKIARAEAGVTSDGQAK
jgi:hypothetical protein